MKKIILLACLFFPLLFFGCGGKDIDAVYTTEYVYKNSMSVPVNMSVTSIYTGEELEKLQILPGEEARKVYVLPGNYTLPFYLRELPYNVYLIVDNGSKQVVSKKIQSKEDPIILEGTGLFDMECYELVSENKFYGKRTYQFIFTDDYFKDGEPIENFPTE